MFSKVSKCFLMFQMMLIVEIHVKVLLKDLRRKYNIRIVIVGNSDGFAATLNNDIFKSVTFNSDALVMFEGELRT